MAKVLEERKVLHFISHLKHAALPAQLPVISHNGKVRSISAATVAQLHLTRMLGTGMLTLASTKWEVNYYSSRLHTSVGRTFQNGDAQGRDVCGISRAEVGKVLL